MMKSFDPLRTLILEDSEQRARQIVSTLASGGFNILAGGIAHDFNNVLAAIATRIISRSTEIITR